ncbi:hypothetical protein [Micromonospora sp. 067-2]|uniref:hypothetical protein n=1 Tax=Micromonospora sp. 067-2 TaxID=2789270 RepID=UPI00397C0017
MHTLAGLVRSLPCYLAFCVTVALTAAVAGTTCVGLGLLACLAAASLTWKRVPVARTSALDSGQVLETAA